MQRHRRAEMALATALVCAPGAARADAVLDWNAIMVRTVSGQNPFAQGRTAATVQLAVFEAVNAITGDYRPYVGGIAAPPDASTEAAAVAAAHTVLRAYVPAEAAALDAARASSLAGLPEGPSKALGLLAGESAAAAVMALRADDGSLPPQFHVPGSTEPGVWQLTPGCPPAGGILLHWGQVRPFGIARSDQFRSAPPPPLVSRRYANDYTEVRSVGDAASFERPTDRADVARFYNVSLAVATWNPAVRQVAASRGATIAENARTFALLNMAISDALVSVMETKYHYLFWRPHTAILRGDEDGNSKTTADADFTPYIPTPCFPSYPSAHASASYAARAVAARIFGERHHAITLTHPAVPDVVLHYTTFGAIARDIDDARIFGGIHFRFDQEAGARQGRQVGSFVYGHHLRRTDGFHVDRHEETDEDDDKDHDDR
jgi:membrane-associated phospholipid phosphatase